MVSNHIRSLKLIRCQERQAPTRAEVFKTMKGIEFKRVSILRVGIAHESRNALKMAFFGIVTRRGVARARLSSLFPLSSNDPKFDVLRLPSEVGRAQHDEETILVPAPASALVRAMGILDGEVVEAKLFLNLAQQLLIGFEQANPDKSVLVFELFAYVHDLHICHTHALGIGGAINYSRTLLAVLDSS